MFVNGLRVAGGARPRIHSWNRPLYFAFASDLLSTGDESERETIGLPGRCKTGEWNGTIGGPGFFPGHRRP